MLAQYIAWRFKIPAIVLLLISGLLLGPVFALVDPQEIFHDFFHVIVEFAVVILLFEGGLQLHVNDLQGAVIGIKRLVSIGVILNGVLTTVLAHYVAGLSWPISSIIGFILVVTGPTVIIPVLRQSKLPKKITSYFKWEGIINDPLGVLLVTLVYQFVTFHGQGSALNETFLAILRAIVFSVGISYIVGAALKALFERSKYPDFLKVPTVLSVILIIYVVSKEIQEGSGLLAVTLLGMFFANSNMRVFKELKKFKESISVFSVSLLFVLLASSIDIVDLKSLDHHHLLFVVAVVLFTRFVSVFAATIGAPMSWQERTLIAWFGPRGIVAASMAGILAFRLYPYFGDEANLILPIVFAVICGTVFVHCLTLVPFAKLLGITRGNTNGLIIVGASPWATELAGLLKEAGVPVMITDTSWYKLKRVRQFGINTHYGEIITDLEQGDLDLCDYSYVLAATESASYNTMVCTELAEDLGRVNVYQLPLEDDSKIEEIPSSQDAQVLDNEVLEYQNLQQRFYYGWTFNQTEITAEFSYSNFLEQYSELNPIHLLTIHKDKTVSFVLDESYANAKVGDTVISFMEPN